uniref:NADH dehydrogenase subunit 6 n=1 Tax=Panopea abrupta TaxID=134997 RepID=A0A343AXN1_9BIVA|nr:NADH dehydrogenase subunit 6 [Panopea abrupta]APU51879.1 NADH dehydrogenase subunit 6 [Panopea abrupta]
MVEVCVSVLSLFIVLGAMSSSHPLVLGGMLLLLSLFSVLYMVMKISSLVGLFLFLVFIGGLLVLFSYVVSLSSNPFISGKVSELTHLLFGMVLLGVLGFSMLSLCLYSVGVGGVVSVLVGAFQWLKLVVVSKLWLKMIIFLSLLLFLSMVAVVNVCSSFKGALIKSLSPLSTMDS